MTDDVTLSELVEAAARGAKRRAIEQAGSHAILITELAETRARLRETERARVMDAAASQGREATDAEFIRVWKRRALEAEAALAAAAQQTCATCRHVHDAYVDEPVCNRIWLRQTFLRCRDVGNRCGAWAAKETL